MDNFGVLLDFKTILCHHHWEPHYRYMCLPALCNAHHVRKLTHAFKQNE